MSKSLFTEYNDIFLGALNEGYEKLSLVDQAIARDFDDSDIKSILEKTTEEISLFLIDDANEVSIEHYKEDEKIRLEFEAHLKKVNERYYVELNGLIDTCVEAIQHHSEYVFESANFNKKEIRNYNIIVRMHARATRISNEIFTLMRSGYGTAALARWRALHEIVTTINYLLKNPKAIDLFIEHDKILSHKAMINYNKYAVRLGQKPFTDREVEASRKRMKRSIAKYTDAIYHDYGWLKVHSNNKINSFGVLDEQYGQDQLRPYYKYASYGIHMNVKSLLSGEENNAFTKHDTHLIGPSEDGMEEVSQIMPISLSYVTTVILTDVLTSPGSIIMAKIIQRRFTLLKEAFTEIYILPNEKPD